MKGTALLLIIFLFFLVPFEVAPGVRQAELESWDFPRLDEIYMIEAYPRSVALEKAEACEIDSFIGAVLPEDVEELNASGWGISSNSGFHMCYFGFNCRDTPPDTAGQYTWFFNRTTDFQIYPLNISQFRLALHYIVGTDKDAWIEDIYEFINGPLDFYIPPASEYWFNPYLQRYEKDWEKAEDILLAAGFTVDWGNDSTKHTTDDIWYMPNSLKLIGGPDSASPGSSRYAGLDEAGDPIYGIFFASPASICSWCEICRRHVRKWNRFFMGVESRGRPDSSNKALFIDLEDYTYDYVYYSPFYNRDHDIYFLCWGLNRNPDYLYDLFHPDMDYASSGNSPGLDHPGLNRMLKAIKFWRIEDYEILDYNVGDEPLGKLLPASTYYALPAPLPPMNSVKVERCNEEFGVYFEVLTSDADYEIIGGELYLKRNITLYSGEALEVDFEPDTYQRLIVNTEELRSICWLAQWKLWHLCPYEPVYSRQYINLYKPGLKCWVESQGYGSAPHHVEMPWTYCSIHWEGTPVGGSINWHIPENVATLHPSIVKWNWEQTILNRLYDSLIVVNPYTHEDMPWAALHWTMEPYINETENVPEGMTVKFWLRNDLYWHDGLHTTAHDVKWNWDFIKRMRETGHFAQFYDMWSTYVKSKVVHDYLVEIYVNATGLWKVYDYAKNALKFPKVIWEGFWDDPEGAEAFEPWAVSYEDWTGLPPPPDKPDLKCLIGTGPFWLDHWDEIDTAHLLKNREYWVRKATKLQGCTQLAGLTTQTQFTKEVNGRLVPVITEREFFDVVVSNIDTKADCTFSYEVFMDKNTSVASGGPITLDPCGFTHIVAEIPLDLPSCVHTWELVVHAATGDNTYILEAACLIADINGDEKVDIIDLYLIVKSFGTHPNQPRWDTRCDINSDNRVDIVDIYISVTHYGESCNS